MIQNHAQKEYLMLRLALTLIATMFIPLMNTFGQQPIYPDTHQESALDARTLKSRPLTNKIAESLLPKTSPFAPRRVQRDKDGSEAEPMILELTILGPDQKPRRDLAVTIISYAKYVGGLATSRTKRTDKNGVARFDNLSRGNVSVDCWPYFKSRYIHLDKGKLKKVRWIIRPGSDFRGTVIDLDANPVANSQVWMQVDRLRRVIAVTDQRGKFHIKDMSMHGSFYATSPGFSPSALHQLPRYGRKGEIKHVYVLGTYGGSFTGVLKSTDGKVIPGSTLYLGAPSRSRGRRSTPFYPSSALTDENGRFTFEGISQGPARITIRSKGYAPYEGEIDIESETVRDIILKPAASVRGTLRDRSGVIVPFASIVIALEKQPRSRSETRTNNKGIFFASDMNGGPAIITYRTGKAFKEEKITLKYGQELQLSATLEVAPKIYGVALDAASSPMSGLHVVLRSSSEMQGNRRKRARSTKTNAEGFFEFGNCENEDHWIQIFDGKNRLREVIAFVRPKQEVIPFNLARLPLASISGHLPEDENGWIDWEVSLRGLPNAKTSVDEATGKFQLNDVFPGTYRLIYRKRRSTTGGEKIVTVRPGQKLDLKELR